MVSRRHSLECFLCRKEMAKMHERLGLSRPKSSKWTKLWSIDTGVLQIFSLQHTSLDSLSLSLSCSSSGCVWSFLDQAVGNT